MPASATAFSAAAGAGRAGAAVHALLVLVDLVADHAAHSRTADRSDRAATGQHGTGNRSDAGANSLFVPFVTSEKLIGRICENSPLPVNILMSPGTPAIPALAALGVARISHGHGPWAKAMDDLAAAAKAAMAVLG